MQRVKGLLLSAKNVPHILETASVGASVDDQYLHPQKDLILTEENSENSINELENLFEEAAQEPRTEVNKGKLEKYAFTYFAGYVCNSSKVQANKNDIEKEFECNLWIRLRDVGRLFYPEQEYLEYIKQFEICFYSIHKNKINHKTNVLKDFIALLQTKYPNLEKSFIVKYSRTRLFTRIKYLRNLQIEKQIEKRKGKFQTERSKMKQIQFSKC